MSHEQELAASFYGKFFARKLQLSLLHRRPEDWKAAQVKAIAGVDAGWKSKSGPTAQTNTAEGSKAEEHAATQTGKRKRKREEKKDEIDVLFEGVKENRFAKVEVTPVAKEEKQHAPDLDGVLGAIKSAPKKDAKKRRKA